MTAAETEQAITPKVPIWRTAKAGYRETYRNLGAFMTAAALPFLVTLIAYALLANLPEGLSVEGLSATVDTVTLSIFGLAWYRHLLLATPEARPRLLPRSDRRLLAYIGYALLLELLMLPVLLLTGLLGETSGGPVAVTIAAAVVLFILALYFNIRFAFLFQWIAVDESGRLGESWRLTKGNGLRLLAVVALLIIPIVVVFGVGTAIAEAAFPNIMNDLDAAGPESGLFWFGLLIDCGLIYVFSGLLGAAFFHAFCHLTGWRSDNREILERFD